MERVATSTETPSSTTTGIRERDCAWCGRWFSYPVGPGRDRKYCQDECRKLAGRRAAKLRSKPVCECGNPARSVYSQKCNRCYSLELKARAGICGVHKCNRPATRTKGTLCEVHYYRNRRTGSFDERPKAGPWVDHQGYVVEWNPSHQLAYPHSGQVRQHRRVAFDEYGIGPHLCFWCGSGINWDDLHVDHLDSDRENNELDNLRLSCGGCNSTRALAQAFFNRILPERVAVMREILGW